MDSSSARISIAIQFHVYILVSHYTVHERIPFKEKNTCKICLYHNGNDLTERRYTLRELVPMETPIEKFNKESISHKLKIFSLTFLMY